MRAFHHRNLQVLVFVLETGEDQLQKHGQHTQSLNPFLTATGKRRLHSMASLVAVFGTRKYHVNFKKKCTPLGDNCKDGTLLSYLLLTEKKIALPGISYYLSQGRYLIHTGTDRKELRRIVITSAGWGW